MFFVPSKGVRNISAIPDGQFVYSTKLLFLLPIAEMIKKTKLIVIDEVTQGNKSLYETVDRSLRETRKCDKPFGGIPTIFSGDWRQCLPVVKGGSRGQIINSTFKRSKLWQHIKKYKLEINMRLKNISCPEEKEFHE